MKIIEGITLSRDCEDLIVTIEDFDKKSIKYSVTNTPICQYDQHSRARIGIQFQNYKPADDPEYILYTYTYDKLMSDDKMLNQFISLAHKIEKLRKASKIKQDYNLMSRNCSYTVVQEYTSLEGQMGRRLQLCEESFIVILHWKLRDEMIKAGLQFANNYLPTCDKVKKCTYAEADFLSNAFGCLFAGCGRWPSHAPYASFNESCTTVELIKEQTGIDIVKSQYEIDNNIR